MNSNSRRNKLKLNLNSQAQSNSVDNNNNNNNKNNKKGQSISVRRKRGIGLGLRVPSRKHDSFHVSDTSYIRENVRIDNCGLQSSSVEEQKSETPINSNSNSNSNSFIHNISEIRLLDVLGSGQSGYVSQAIHIPTKTMMAVKQISVYEKSRRSQISNEYNALYETQCDGLVSFHGIFFSKGSVCIVLEYCECGSLLDVIKKTNNIPEPALAQIAISVLKGLMYLHNEKKQIHRDIKPSNICLTSAGLAKLTDFGISRELKDSMNCRTVVGTVTYMSPERIRAEEYSFKCDIWGVGITLMECALGKFPYPETPYYLELIQFIASEPAPRFPDNTADGDADSMFSDLFKDFVYQCIHKDPEQRLSAEQLFEHAWIEQHLQSQFDMKQWIADNHLVVNVPEIDISNDLNAIQL